MRKKISKKPMTLLEIMIVIFLIGLISSVIGYNMKGSLDKGRVFKTKQGSEQLRDLLYLEVAQGASIDDVVAHPDVYLKNSGMVKDVDKFLKDGWNKPYVISIDEEGQIDIISEGLKTYEEKHGSTTQAQTNS